MYLNIDEKFLKHFQNLKQVFIYIIDDCNLECKHCLYKPSVKFHIGSKEISLNTAINLISDCFELGATKLSILGGEPTLYGIDNDNKPLFDLIQFTNEIGYKYIRLDTNGLFNPEILYNHSFRQLNELSFSIDGYDEETNDNIRGHGAFNKAINNINLALRLGYNVNITSCIYNQLLEKDKIGDYKFEKIIYLAEKIGVSKINFHILIKDGTPIDTWSDDFFVDVSSWVDCYNKLINNIKHKKYTIDVRVPQTFVNKEIFNKNPYYYGYCPAKLGERVLIHPNGIIRICSGLLGTPYGVAFYNDNKIIWNDTKTNELLDHDLKNYTPCTNRGKKNYGTFNPLCFSFKPNQSEYIWCDHMEWDYRNETHDKIKL